MFKVFSLILLMFFATRGAFSQVYNIPPNARIQGKAETEIDISKQLSHLDDFDVNSPIKAMPLRSLTQSEWTSLEQTNPDEYVYYQEAKDYYESLPRKIKCALTTEELWAVYYFDTALSDQLLSYQ
jgi:hypothetical protein